MKITAVLLLIAVALSSAVGGGSSRPSSDDPLMAKARALAEKFLIVDTHIDAPMKLQDKEEDLSSLTQNEFDYVKSKAGGLNCAFMSVYIPASYQNRSGRSKALADTLISMVGQWEVRWPGKFMIARSVADVTAQSSTERVSLAMGMENGAAIEDDLANVQYFYNRGIRYVTLTHSKDNLICDSSYDTTGTWKGLSPFGRRVVEEMNRVGIMVDVSHISDSAFYQVMRISKAPVIASHSSCRHFTPGFERNMSDDMIKLLASGGGVIQINFGSSFISNEYRTAGARRRQILAERLQAKGISPRDSAGEAYAEAFRQEHPIAFADVSEVAAHIDHVVKLVGVEYVGLGSDFDGVGDSLPTGLKDVSYYPNLIHEFLKLGYSEDDIQKICSGNLLRVWSQVEQTAKQLQQKKD